MQRARRLAASVLLTVCAAGALSACGRAEPDVAAYIGSTRITEARVDEVYEDAQVKLAAAQRDAQQQAADPNAVPPQPTVSRARVVSMLVGLDVLRAATQQRDIQAAPMPVDEIAEGTRLPADAEYVRLLAQYRGHFEAFAQQAKPAQTLTDADLREVYERMRAGGALGESDMTFEQFLSRVSPSFRNDMQKEIGLRNELAAVVKGLDVQINPRYGTVDLGLLSIGAPEDGSKPAVVDLP